MSICGIFDYMKKGYILAITAITIIGFVLACIALYKYIDIDGKIAESQSETSELAEKSAAPFQDPDILNRLKMVGAGYTDQLELRYVDQFSNVKSREEGIKALFYNNNTPKIEVLNSSKIDSNLDNTIAHEYLHYIWYDKMTEDQKASLSSRLIVLYSSDQQAKDRMINYANANKLTPTEMFSIYCTESSDGYIESIVADCNKYINRSMLTLQR